MLRLAVLAAAILLLGSPGLSGTPAIATGTSTTSAQFDDAVRFRSDFGLNRDAAFVSASFSDPSYDQTEWGVPLSPSERDDLSARSDLREQFQPILELAAAHPSYAGAYIDQQRHGTPVVLSTDPPSMMASLPEQLVDGVRFEIVLAKWTLEELTAARDLLVGEMSALEQQDASIQYVGIDIRANAVSVGVDASSVLPPSLPGGVDVKVSTVAPVTLDACTDMAHCWPMKGGIRVRLVANTAYKCTSGYMARRTDTNALVVVTAGHCLALANNSGTDYWGHKTNPSAANNFGHELANTWFNDSLADVGLLTLDADAVAALDGEEKNTLHAYDPSTNYPVLGVRSAAYQLPGDAVCRMGWGTWHATGQGRTCGIVGSVTDARLKSCESGLSCSTYIKHQWKVSFDSVAGDSGGPVYQQKSGYDIAYGTHVHSGSGSGAVGWYSPIEWGIAAYSTVKSYTYSVCISSGC